MYITGKDRYKNYTSRYDVYLFTLRDYVEVLLDRFKGTYIERSDMPIHSGYLLKFISYDDAVAFISAAAESESTDVDVTTYVLPHLEGNEFPVYATTKVGQNQVYIGLSEYADVFGPASKILAPGVEAYDKSLFGYEVSDLQSDIAVDGTKITGTLNYLKTGSLVDTWGEGNFIALKCVADDWSGFTSVKIGMDPSVSSGLVEIIDDPDKGGAFKVSNSSQKFVVEATDGTNTVRVEYDLSEVQLATA